MLNLNDYVEGYEHYGSSIFYIRGWVSEFRYDKTGLCYCYIKCDDSYNGARGNSLIIDKQYPIKKIAREIDWYFKINRKEMANQAIYRVGLDKDFLLDKDVVRFWDVDGVLAMYAFGAYGVNGCDDEIYGDYIKNVNPYIDALAPSFLKDYIDLYTKSENNYVVSRILYEEEKDIKIDFILRNYKDRFLEENIYFVNSSDKTLVIKDILGKKFNGLSTKHCLIDDSINVLSNAQLEGITTVHISSFLNLQL